MLMFILCADKYSWKMKILLSFNIGKTYFLWIHNLLFLPWETPPPHHYLHQQEVGTCHWWPHLQQRESWALRGNTALPPSPSPTHPQTSEKQVITTKNRTATGHSARRRPQFGPSPCWNCLLVHSQRLWLTGRSLLTKPNQDHDVITWAWGGWAQCPGWCRPPGRWRGGPGWRRAAGRTGCARCGRCGLHHCIAFWSYWGLSSHDQCLQLSVIVCAWI